MWMRMIVHVHLVIWCEKRCIQQERLNFEISPPIGNYLCLSNFSRLSNNNRNQVLKGFSIKLRFFSLCFLFVLFFSMENVTTQCDILTDNLNAKSHDCFGSFVLRFGIVFDSVNWNSIKHRLWCGSYENLTCIRMDMFSSFFDANRYAAGQKLRRKSIDYVHICWWFLPHRISINQPKKETHKIKIAQTQQRLQTGNCVWCQRLFANGNYRRNTAGNRIHISTCFDWNHMTEQYCTAT